MNNITLKCCEEYAKSCVHNEDGICTNEDRKIDKYGCQSQLTDEDLYEMQIVWNSECDYCGDD